MSDESSKSAQSAYLGWKGWGDSNLFGRCSQAASAYFEAELIASDIRLAKGSKVLELGFGNGEFLGFCRERELNYVGTEIDPVLIETAREAGFRALEAQSALGALQEEASGFDLVAAFDVLEHLDSDLLIQTLHGIQRILKPAGHLLFRVPSGDSPFARAIQNGDLTHRTSLGSSAVVQLAMLTGFRSLQIREPAFIYRGLDIRSFSRRLLVQAFRRLTFPIMRTAYFSGADVVLTQNLVACFMLSDAGND